MYKIMKKKCKKSDFKEIFLKLATNDGSDRMFLLTSKFCPKDMYKVMKEMYKIRLQRDLKLVANDRSDKRFLLT